MKSKNKNANENIDFPQDDYQDVLTSMEMFNQRAKLSKEKIVEFDEAFRAKLMATPELGKDILNFIVNLSDQNQKIHDKVISVHQSTIDHLFKRLDKEDITEEEMGMIYGELRFLTEQVDKARKEWKDTVEKLAIGGLVLVTGAVGTYFAAKLNDRDKN
ncbi:hypothetical protein BBH88_03355 [Planococcus antarcticus DSM 14505]|uniref:Uncharacterized protein n=1 Tax=Planococcus antarcticus DSM 14505 TaxID=1185653 RepID=A0ABM6D2J8_9BACL|nr:hypothetical protein [Planococcus antarcticus]ANU09413.1 hypothetical protein BBH88_03355 [Planococcus antarcticus DSM 14505]